MTYDALFVGSIGVLADTSDLQRQAFNHAFDRFGLGWHWDWPTYVRLLQKQGGRQRIADYAEEQGVSDIVDAGAVYAVKQGAFDALARSSCLKLRPGLDDLLSAAGARGLKRAFVSSTSRAQIDATFEVLRGSVDESVFDHIGDRSQVARAKPAPDIYEAALTALDVAPDAVLAIEDTPESAEAALQAGIKVIGFPGRAAYGRDFPAGVPVVECLTPTLLSMPRARIAVAAE